MILKILLGSKAEAGVEGIGIKNSGAQRDQMIEETGMRF